jgi:hypothetical protein
MDLDIVVESRELQVPLDFATALVLDRLGPSAEN